MISNIACTLVNFTGTFERVTSFFNETVKINIGKAAFFEPFIDTMEFFNYEFVVIYLRSFF